MAHFAKLDENNVVLEVNSVHNDELLVDGVEMEAKGVAFLVMWSGGYPFWKQTSYNGNFRFNFAGISYTYDEVRDGFIPPKCHDEATVNDLCLWDCTNKAHDPIL
jgi:hypothetical protein